MRIFIIRLLLPSKRVALDKFPLSREYLRIKLRIDIAARQGDERRPPRRRLAREQRRERRRASGLDHQVQLFESKSEENTSELPSLMRSFYAVLFMKKRLI